MHNPARYKVIMYITVMTTKIKLIMINKNKKSDHRTSGTARHKVIKRDTLMSYTSQESEKCRKQWYSFLKLREFFVHPLANFPPPLAN